MKRWILSKINQGYQMTRYEKSSRTIECRNLHWWEKIRYCIKILKLPKSAKD